MIKAFDEIFLTYKKVKAVIYHFQGQSLPKTAIFSGVRREMKIPVLKFRKKNSHSTTFNEERDPYGTITKYFVIRCGHF